MKLLERCSLKYMLTIVVWILQKFWSSPGAKQTDYILKELLRCHHIFDLDV